MVRKILEFKENAFSKESIPIPYERLKALYEERVIKELYDFAEMEFSEFDEFEKFMVDFIDSEWETAAIDTPFYYYKIGRFYLDMEETSKAKTYVE